MLYRGLCVVILLFFQTTGYGQLPAYEMDSGISWEQQYPLGLSPDRKWIQYSMYKDIGDSGTVSIRPVAAGTSFDFQGGFDGRFDAGSRWYAVRSADDQLLVVNLQQRKVDTIRGVKRFDLMGSKDVLVIQTASDTVQLHHLASGKRRSLGSSSRYLPNPSRSHLAMVLREQQGEVLAVYDIDRGKVDLVPWEAGVRFTQLAWSGQGQQLGFLSRSAAGKSHQLGCYDLGRKTVERLEESLFPAAGSGLRIADGKLALSERGDRVFFHSEPSNPAGVNVQGVEVWNTMDPLLHSQLKSEEPGREGPWVNVWQPVKGTVVPIGTRELPTVICRPDHAHALQFDVLGHGPNLLTSPEVDLYSLDMRTGIRELVLARQYLGIGHVHFSPAGQYLAYFREGDWWAYSLTERKHRNLTRGLGVRFDDANESTPVYSMPYGLEGWANDDRDVLVYDRYDIWRLSSDGSSRERLTRGRKDATVYRIVKGPLDERIDYGSSGFDTYALSSVDGLLLRALRTGDLKSGFYQWKAKDWLREIAFGEKSLTNLFQLDPDRFIFQEQDFAVPPSLVVADLRKKVSTTVQRSNPGWGGYAWPERRLLHYAVPHAEPLKGVLVYPLDYDPSRTYPMVVHVYREQSVRFHQFRPPSDANEAGFNVMQYALDGYFVLLPDIQNEKGRPGFSALECVERAVDKALASATIDPKRVGLIGHSFGGYETCFIISQTDRYAAAVSGAGIFNLVGFYLDIYKMGGYSEMVRVENSQWRIQESYFGNPAAYQANSPLHHASRINTPLLLWTGKEDPNVNPNQSMQAYLALRRMGKPGLLYQFDGEGHSLQLEGNRKALSAGIKAWFDSHLK